MQRFSFYSLRSRLMLLLLLALLPALALALCTGLEERQIQKAQVQENTLRLARLAAGDLVQVIEGARQLLIGLAQLPEVRQGDPEVCSELFADLLAQYPYYANLGVADSQGRLSCSAVSPNTPAPLFDRTEPERPFSTKGFAMSGYRLDGITNKAVMNFAYPVITGPGSPDAIVFASLDLEWFRRLDMEAQLPKDAAIVVIDHRGTILARFPDPDKWRGRFLPEENIVKAALSHSGETTVEVRGVDNVLRLYGITRVPATPETNVYVCIGISKEIAFAPVNRLFFRNIAGLGLVGVTTLLATWFLGDRFILRRLDALLRATRRLASGDLKVRMGSDQKQDELSLLASSFDDMAEALEQRTGEIHRAEIKYRNLVTQMRDLAAHNEAVREEERTMIAREIHDELGQALTGLKMDLAWLERKLPGPVLAESHPPLQEKVESMKRLIESTIQTVRKISTELRPGVLDNLGLLAALEWQASDFQKRTGIQCTFSPLPESVTSLEEKRSSAIFRIFQEILTNVARHANATRVDIRLRVEGEALLLEVQDNGRGITESQSSNVKSLGLLGMRERTLLLGGDFHIGGIPGQGTTVTVKIPLT